MWKDAAPQTRWESTNYRRNEAGIISKDGYKFDTREFAIDFYSMVYSALLAVHVATRESFLDARSPAWAGEHCGALGDTLWVRRELSNQL